MPMLRRRRRRHRRCSNSRVYIRKTANGPRENGGGGPDGEEAKKEK